MTDPTLQSLFTVAIPDYWTPEQALAIVEFIDNLHDAIWANYREQLLDAYRELHQSDPGAKPPSDSSF
jgi:hypothetical protein